MVDWLDAAAAAGVSIVQWDELHLALPHRPQTQSWACRCEACQAAYLAQYGADLPRSMDATGSGIPGPIALRYPHLVGRCRN